MEWVGYFTIKEERTRMELQYIFFGILTAIVVTAGAIVAISNAKN